MMKTVINKLQQMDIGESSRTASPLCAFHGFSPVCVLWLLPCVRVYVLIQMVWPRERLATGLVIQ